ncbi:putative NADH-flavin reductase [Mumia flava]|uniref:Putative NADH-flavin reductase n=1 Tax=Mumia flava TaxID=1348852 RepID=A0A0B2B7D9_9ACTN|nr:SDR family oxidoreductase [Mumia flava]PJJ57719.1 putative NADH-flavin reductase [Mumia flava]
MNITVFGATGTVGRLVVEQALAAGHDVTAVTRDADRVTQRHDRLRVVQGDPTEPEVCAPAVKGADAVIVTLGAGRQGRVREAGTRAVVAAMHETGARRLVCQSTLGVGSSRRNLNLWWRYVMFGALLRPAYADHVRQEDVVTASGLDWTIVRPSAFTDAPGDALGELRHGFAGDERGLRLKVSRADVAAFLLAQAADPAYLHRAVSVSA